MTFLISMRPWPKNRMALGAAKNIFFTAFHSTQQKTPQTRHICCLHWFPQGIWLHQSGSSLEQGFAIRGPFLSRLQSLYSQVSSCVWINEDLTKWFDINSGVKQGCILSPVLFSMFINKRHWNQRIQLLMPALRGWRSIRRERTESPMHSWCDR